MIICGDAKDELAKLDDGSIDLAVTSPPYDNLRAYNGYSFDFEAIAKELYRVIKDGGVLIWVVGDATIDGSETGTSFRQALFFKSLGMNLYDTMIYAKANPIPLSHNRYEQAFEYMFVLTKGYPKTINLITEKKIHTNAQPGNFYKDAKDKQTTKFKSFSHNTTKIRTNVWSYIVGHNNFGHPAVFPKKLAADHIRTWSNEGDLVLDPFLGSGTTARAAKDLNREFIGIEISPEYCEVAEKRLMQEILL